jgi:hypothetical protein
MIEAGSAVRTRQFAVLAHVQKGNGRVAVHSVKRKTQRLFAQKILGPIDHSPLAKKCEPTGFTKKVTPCRSIAMA